MAVALMISNCHIHAWGRFVRDEAEWLAFRKTRYSRCSNYARRWYWKPLVPVGIALQWIGSIVTAVGWLVRWGSWYHMIWISPGGEWWEYVPQVKKRYRIIPPVIFSGKVQKVTDKNYLMDAAK